MNAQIAGILNRDPRPLVLPEAGGDSAHSFYAFLPPEYRQRVVAVDDNYQSLAVWRAMGRDAAATYRYYGGTILPTDEVYRWRSALSSPLAGGDVATVHSKTRAYNVLAFRTRQNYHLPKRILPGVVVRKNQSSGGKGTQIFRIGGSSDHEDDLLITEWIHGTEYVVDVNMFTQAIYPRATHHVKHGRDTYCTLVGPYAPLYGLIRAATLEICYALGMSGIGNVQLIATPGASRPDFYFIEAALRLSGSAWLNAAGGGNPVMGIPFTDGFEAKEVSTVAAFGEMKEWHDAKKAS